MLNNKFKTFTIVLLAVGMTASLAACGRAEQGNLPVQASNITAYVAETENTINGISSGAELEETGIQLTFGNTIVTAVLDDSETSQAFIEMLPLTLIMHRYADREYYAALDELPENGASIENFENGDVTYYTEGEALAIFFDGADTSFQDGLIRMGRITSPLSLFDAFGENVVVTIALSESEVVNMVNFDFSVFSNVEIAGIKTTELSTEEQMILYQTARYCQAMTEADTETMRELTSPDMVFTHMSGRQQTRDEYFADITDGALRYFTIGIENPVVNIYGGYASITYTSVLNADAYGARGVYRINGTHWYERQNENWIKCNRPE